MLPDELAALFLFSSEQVLQSFEEMEASISYVIPLLAHQTNFKSVIF